MDNAKINRTSLIKSLINKFNVIILYTAISSPKLNLIEYFFEYIKRNIRKTIAMKYKELQTEVFE